MSEAWIWAGSGWLGWAGLAGLAWAGLAGLAGLPGQSQANDPIRTIPNDESQANDPKRKFPRERFQARGLERKQKFPKQGSQAIIPSRRSEAKVAKRTHSELPSERPYAKTHKRHFPGEGSQGKILSDSFRT